MVGRDSRKNTGGTLRMNINWIFIIGIFLLSGWIGHITTCLNGFPTRNIPFVCIMTASGVVGITFILTSFMKLLGG